MQRHIADEFAGTGWALCFSRAERQKGEAAIAMDGGWRRVYGASLV